MFAISIYQAVSSQDAIVRAERTGRAQGPRAFVRVGWWGWRHGIGPAFHASLSQGHHHWHYGSEGWCARAAHSHPAFSFRVEQEVEVGRASNLDEEIEEDSCVYGGDDYDLRFNNCCSRAQTILRRMKDLNPVPSLSTLTRHLTLMYTNV